MKLYFLLSDFFVWAFMLGSVVFILWASRQHFYREAFRRFLQQKLAVFCFVIVAGYACVTILDSFHFRFQNLDTEGKSVMVKNENGGKEYTYYAKPVSSLDMLLAKCYSGIDFEKGKRSDGSAFEIGKLDYSKEDSYSAPFATTLFDKTRNQEGKWVNEKLKYVDKEKTKQRNHWLGTDKAGGDIFYKLMKGIRTALVVGLVATMLVIPLSMIFGLLAGYFGGKVDDVIQFIYITLSSVPSILLISAMMLIVQTSSWFEKVPVVIKDDCIIIFLCFILAIISWAGLCRLLRAETIKLREHDFVKAARALGVNHFVIIIKHIIPNVLHIVLISAILRFSGLVMIETILTYINIGVPKSVIGWGRVVDGARTQLGRDPIIWWPILGVFVFMFVLILCINIVGDAVRDSLDPKLRT